MGYTPQTFNSGASSGGASVQDPSALATALENLETAIVALGDVSQTSAALTDSTGGTASDTLAAISGSGADSDINNNFADLAAQVNALIVDVAAILATVS